MTVVSEAIDGRDRINCIKYSDMALKNGVVIILDNSERKEYDEGIKYLGERG